MDNNKKPKLIGEARYLDEKGNLSESFAVATEYGNNDWALVQKDIFSDYNYRYVDGTLSESYYTADIYKHGWGLVRKTKESGKQFRDNNGKLSEEFYNARHYMVQYKETEPFAIVRKEKTSPMQFRDKEGRLSEPFLIIRPHFYGFKVVKKHGDKLDYISLEDIKKSINAHNNISTM